MVKLWQCLQITEHFRPHRLIQFAYKPPQVAIIHLRVDGETCLPCALQPWPPQGKGLCRVTGFSGWYPIGFMSLCLFLTFLLMNKLQGETCLMGLRTCQLEIRRFGIFSAKGAQANGRSKGHSDLLTLVLLPRNRFLHPPRKGALPTPRGEARPHPCKRSPRRIRTNSLTRCPHHTNLIPRAYHILPPLSTLPLTSIDHSGLFLWVFISSWRLPCPIKLRLNAFACVSPGNLSVSVSFSSRARDSKRVEETFSAPPCPRVWWMRTNGTQRRQEIEHCQQPLIFLLNHPPFPPG